MTNFHKWIADSPTRLISFIKEKSEEFEIALNTSDLHWCIERQRCWVNQKVERFASKRIEKGDQVFFWPLKPPIYEKEKSRILFEDTHLLIYDKPPFIDTLNLGAMLNTSIVHRLDRDTSGVLVFAKHQEAQNKMEQLFKERKLKKEYFALIHGNPGRSGKIEGYMRCKHKREGACIWELSDRMIGQSSKTTWTSTLANARNSLIKCQPITGRTHQIRVHLQWIGHPIVGDLDYGSRKATFQLFRPLLHASALGFQHPFTNKWIQMVAPEPDDFIHWKEKLLS